MTTPTTPTAPAAPLTEWLQVMTDEVSRKREAEAAAAAEAQQRASGAHDRNVIPPRR